MPEAGLDIGSPCLEAKERRQGHMLHARLSRDQHDKEVREEAPLNVASRDSHGVLLGVQTYMLGGILSSFPGACHYATIGAKTTHI